MYRKILLAYDGTREGRAVLREGADLAKAFGAEAILLSIVNLPSYLILAEAVASDGLPSADQQEAEQILAEGVSKMQAYGVEGSGQLAVGEPEQEILRVAQAEQVDLIVIGHRRKATWEFWRFGSVGQRLLNEAQCSVLVAVER